MVRGGGGGVGWIEQTEMEESIHCARLRLHSLPPKCVLVWCVL